MKVSRLIELLQEFQKTYGDLEPVYCGARPVIDVDKTNDTNPNSESAPYYMGGICMIVRGPLTREAIAPLSTIKSHVSQTD